MPTLHEILGNAPNVPTGGIAIEKVKPTWEVIRGYVVTESSTGIKVEGAVMAALLWYSAGLRTALLPNTGDREDFLALVKSANLRLTTLTKPNLKAAAFHTYIRNNWG